MESFCVGLPVTSRVRQQVAPLGKIRISEPKENSRPATVPLRLEDSNQAESALSDKCGTMLSRLLGVPMCSVPLALGKSGG